MLCHKQELAEVQMESLLVTFESSLTPIENTLQKLAFNQEQASSKEQLDGI